MANWRDLISEEMEQRGETLNDLESCTLTEEQLDQEFDDSLGGRAGAPFTAWTARTCYFPVVYDGAEWVGSVSRNPDGRATEHQGDGG